MKEGEKEDEGRVENDVKLNETCKFWKNLKSRKRIFKENPSKDFYNSMGVTGQFTK